jgi:hypothetical protein
MRSSYHGHRMDDEVFRSLPQFTAEPLRYGDDGRPAPGGRRGLAYDEGVLAYKVEHGELVLAVASPLDPRRWHASRGSLVGQGDLFVTVDQGGVRHFALLNEMQEARDVRHDGYFVPAQRFRHPAEEESLVGRLVELTGEEDVLLSGGDQGHARHGNSPEGLDERAFARGGRVLGAGEVQHYSLDCTGQKVEWIVSEWTLPLHALGDASAPMTLALHVAPSCGNDQIGGIVTLEPDPVRNQIN